MNKTILTKMVADSTSALEKAATALGDKADWSPLDKGRSAINQVVECGGLMHLAAQTVSSRAFPQMTQEERIAMRDKALADNPTLDKALASLHAGANALTDALSEISDDELQLTVVLPFGGGMEKTIGETVAMMYWNSTYHEGQINYIATLV